MNEYDAHQRKTCPSATFVTKKFLYCATCRIHWSGLSLDYAICKIHHLVLSLDWNICRKHHLVLSLNCNACRKHQLIVYLDGVVCRTYLQYISNIQQFKYGSFHQPHIGNIKFTGPSVSQQNNYKHSSTAGVTLAYFLKVTKQQTPAHFQRLGGKTFRSLVMNM